MLHPTLVPGILPEHLCGPPGSAWLCSRPESRLHCCRNQLGAARWSVAPSAGRVVPLRCLCTTSQCQGHVFNHPSIHACMHYPINTYKETCIKCSILSKWQIIVSSKSVVLNWSGFGTHHHPLMTSRDPNRGKSSTSQIYLMKRWCSLNLR